MQLWRVMCALGLLTLLLVSCTREEPNIPKEVSISWSEIEQSVGMDVGDTLEIVLPANPSTGYSWEVGFYNQSVLEPYGEPEFSESAQTLGAAETQKLHFNAIGEGESELVLVYKRSFEAGAEVSQTFKVNVSVK